MWAGAIRIHSARHRTRMLMVARLAVGSLIAFAASRAAVVRQEALRVRGQPFGRG
jgi:hypothetical protein